MNVRVVKGYQPPPEPTKIVVELSLEEASYLLSAGDMIGGPGATSQLYIASGDVKQLEKIRDHLRRLSGAIRYAEHG